MTDEEFYAQTPQTCQDNLCRKIDPEKQVSIVEDNVGSLKDI